MDDEGDPVSELGGSNAVETHELTATVTLHFEVGATEDKEEPLHLDEVSISLQQVVDPSITD